MKKFIKLCVFLIFIQSYSQGGFEDNTILKREFQQRPENIFSVDIDNDGDLDIYVGEYDVILWFENLDGNGTFSDRKIISNLDVQWSESMDVGDIDNDGDIDIVYTSRNENRLVLVENIANGSFFHTSILIDNTNTAQTDITNVQLVDIDNDGNLDLLYENSFEIIWQPNTLGNGDFGEPVVIASDVYNILNIKHGDMDNDNYEDIVVTSHNGLKLFWYKNINGTGSFSVAQVISSSDPDYPKGLHISDLDNDGDNDIISGENSGIYWYKNDGNGSFNQRSLISPNGQGGRSVYTDDIDNDGDLDVLNASGAGMFWYKNDGEENFSTQPTINENVSQAYCIITGDFDGNGTIDVASGSSYKTSWYKNTDGLGNFSPEINLYPLHWSPTKVMYDDMDNDGDVDLIVCAPMSIAWYENINGYDRYNQKTVFYGVDNSNMFDNIRSMYVADLDADGDKDILAINKDWEVLPEGEIVYYDKVVWFENTDGYGNFGDRKTISTLIEGGSDVLAIDIDNDTDLDVVSLSTSDDTLAWYENTDGDASFGSQKIISTDIDSGSSLYTEDLDNDNDFDILVSSNIDGKILWFENSGNGDFSPLVVLSDTADGATSVTASDLDGDLDLDVIYTSEDNNQVAWLENLDGNANFGAPQIISDQTLGASFVRAGDIDEDSDIDIVVAAFDSGQIEWFENLDGTGNFSTVKIVTDDAREANSVEILNIIDGDYKEIVYTAKYWSKIAWCQNLDALNLSENKLTTTMRVFPNPTSGIIHIDSKYDVVRIELYNIKGQLIQHIEKTDTLDKIDMSLYNSGIYILKINDGDSKSHSFKIIKP